MKPFLVLIATSVLSAFAIKLITGSYNLALSARIGMCCMLLFTAIGHFAFTSGMMMMIPLSIPFRRSIVYLTGLLEIVLGVGMVTSHYQVTGYLLILFFLIILPANIYAALKRIDYQTAQNNGYGAGYLFFRIPLQFLFMVWVYASAILN